MCGGAHWVHNIYAYIRYYMCAWFGLSFASLSLSRYRSRLPLLYVSPSALSCSTGHERILCVHVVSSEYDVHRRATDWFASGCRLWGGWTRVNDDLIKNNPIVGEKFAWSDMFMFSFQTFYYNLVRITNKVFQFVFKIRDFLLWLSTGSTRNGRLPQQQMVYLLISLDK